MLIIDEAYGSGNGYDILHTNPSASGMSGGPILNTRGDVIGIHGRGELGERLSVGRASLSDIKANVNSKDWQGVKQGLSFAQLATGNSHAMDKALRKTEELNCQYLYQ